MISICFFCKSKEEREKEKRVNDVLKRTDDFIERTKTVLDEMQKDDKRWRNYRTAVATLVL